FAEQRSRTGFVGNVETRRDICLKRKARQQAFAKGVNGLDFEAAGRFQRLREKRAGAREIGSVGAELLKFRGKALIVSNAPTAETLEQAALHLGGGGFCVSDAEERGRLRAFKQEPRD